MTESLCATKHTEELIHFFRFCNFLSIAKPLTHFMKCLTKKNYSSLLKKICFEEIGKSRHSLEV